MSANENLRGAEVRVVLEKQRAAWLASAPWTAEQRCELIDRAIGLLVDYQDDIVAALAADFGHRSADFSRLFDVLSPLASMKYTKSQVATWMRDEPRHTDRGEAWVRYQPLGVVGILTAWNFPGNMIFNGLAGALAAGNRVMIKLSEFNPHTSALIARIFPTVFADDEVAIVTGGAEVGQAFCALPFDHLLFTGASSIGKHVMRAAAENLVPVTLELGGKSPTIISRSADLAAAVSKIITGKLHNAGQICLAPDYVFVPEEHMAEFISLAKATVAKLYPTLKDNPDYTSVINARHFERLHDYLAQARDAGVHTVELNPANEDFSGQPHHKIAPTLLLNPDDSLKVMQDEIFGPLLPVKPYSDIQAVVAYINSHPRPLGLYYFGSHAEEEAFVLERTTSGGVCVNDVLRHGGVETLPFGGVGASGMGAYHGFDGFRTFSHARAVLRAADGPDLMRPPYSDPVRQLVGSLIKR
ncbi:coniferyl aldehyde dehydrogenase [Pseudomonas sp. JQ170]|uniref:coniferyl aldehyde dehydrogenase n=1 Tax=unclassified Pseudomonas TaxID=196821 RepID=UPI002653CC9C|nr:MULTISPECIES: coniferyl aldehyde dehydrogenase [unclassified Pseudomonas]MDN7140077.1 coniferyl aldehyde dehydrogenase [Pseudomonas sp. JQ170]WRO78566.1 coniferyl aldehyde dehydrogenase [Pseudomonas sp. 170C]